MGGYQAVKEYCLQVKKTLRRNKKLIKNSADLGVKPKVAAKEPNLNLILQVLFTRGVIEDVCAKPIGIAEYTRSIEVRLDQAFRGFIGSSIQLNSIASNPTLTRECERINEMFVQKKLKFISYRSKRAALSANVRNFSEIQHLLADLEGGEV